MTTSTKTKAKKQVTKASTWKKNSGAHAQDVELPSGNVAKIRIPGLPSLLAQGLIADSLMPMVNKQIDAGKNGRVTKKSKQTTDQEIAELMRDPQKFQDMMDTFDKVLVACVVEPKVLYYKYTEDNAPAEDLVNKVVPDDARDDETLYSDEVDMEDKSFIFNLVSGGTRDIETFRRQQSQSVAGLQAVPVADDETE